MHAGFSVDNYLIAAFRSQTNIMHALLDSPFAKKKSISNISAGILPYRLSQIAYSVNINAENVNNIIEFII